MAILHRRYHTYSSFTNEEAEVTCLMPYPSSMAELRFEFSPCLTHEGTLPSNDKTSIDGAEVGTWVEYKLTPD